MNHGGKGMRVGAWSTEREMGAGVQCVCFFLYCLRWVFSENLLRAVSPGRFQFHQVDIVD